MEAEKQIATIRNVGLQFLNNLWSQGFRVVAVIGHAYYVLRLNSSALSTNLDEIFISRF